jgi:hypothetical protein
LSTHTGHLLPQSLHGLTQYGKDPFLVQDELHAYLFENKFLTCFHFFYGKIWQTNLYLMPTGKKLLQDLNRLYLVEQNTLLVLNKYGNINRKLIADFAVVRPSYILDALLLQRNFDSISGGASTSTSAAGQQRHGVDPNTVGLVLLLGQRILYFLDAHSLAKYHTLVVDADHFIPTITVDTPTLARKKPFSRQSKQRQPARLQFIQSKQRQAAETGKEPTLRNTRLHRDLVILKDKQLRMFSFIDSTRGQVLWNLKYTSFKRKIGLAHIICWDPNPYASDWACSIFGILDGKKKFFLELPNDKKNNISDVTPKYKSEPFLVENEDGQLLGGLVLTTTTGVDLHYGSRSYTGQLSMYKQPPPGDTDADSSKTVSGAVSPSLAWSIPWNSSKIHEIYVRRGNRSVFVLTPDSLVHLDLESGDIKWSTSLGKEIENKAKDGDFYYMYDKYPNIIIRDTYSVVVVRQDDGKRLFPSKVN